MFRPEKMENEKGVFASEAIGVFVMGAVLTSCLLTKKDEGG